MKTCHNCSETKDLSAFNKNKGRKDGYASTCRDCMKLLRKDHYSRNKDKVVASVMERRRAITAAVWQVKCASSCVDCGESDPRVLEFDHLPEYEKEFTISAAGQMGLGLDRVLKEIEKCEVVCANHHRIRTH